MCAYYRVLCVAVALQAAWGQYPRSSNKYKELMAEGEEDLEQVLEANPYYHAPTPAPDPLASLAEAKTRPYSVEFPEVQNFQVNVIVDPCLGLDYDCCVERYGTPEYPILTDPGLESYRRVVPMVIATDEPLGNTELVYEDGSAVDTTTSRTPKDEIHVNNACTGEGTPYTYCEGFRQAHVRSTLRPSCLDNNSTVNGLSSCYDSKGNMSDYCMAVAYQSNVFVVQCGGRYADDEECGTYLELHRNSGSFYFDEETVLGATRLSTTSKSGYNTTTMSLFYMNHTDRVLCNYEETIYRVGTMVLITDQSHQCCCPHSYEDATLLGAYWCPLNGDRGPTAGQIDTTAELLKWDSEMGAYPFCTTPVDGGDVLMCSTFSDVDQRFVAERCHSVIYNSTLEHYNSPSLSSAYTDQCRFVDSCAALPDEGCAGDDSVFNFIGLVGRVVEVPDDIEGGYYQVTFNDGRTSYPFLESEMKIEQPVGNYEIWWVQRTLSQRIVQKKKSFRVSSPVCTFDATNNRYFPYAILSSDGGTVDSAI